MSGEPEYVVVGERVRIRASALAGLEGVLVRKKDGFRVVLSVVLGVQQATRSVAVEIDADDLERASSCSQPAELPAWTGFERDSTCFLSQPGNPPRAAKLLLLLLPTKNREHLLGDLEEEFRTILVPEYGLRKAQLWYWWHVFISMAPLVWAAVKRIVAANLCGS